jgi:chromosomal replication initiation ATPase DnaA
MSVSCSGEAAGARATPRQTIRGIVDEEAAKAGVSAESVLGPSRRRAVVAARHAAIRRVHETFPSKSTPDIGRIFARHHTTILYALGALKRKARSCR